MNSADLHQLAVVAMFALAGITALSLVFVTAPYGRHSRAGWGPTIPSRLGWLVMESPAVLAFVGFYLAGDHRAETAPLVMLGLWLVHYGHRSFIFPFRMRSAGKRMPVLIALLAIAFNLLNAYVNATWIAELGSYRTGWLTDPRFVAGAALFATGFAINVRADSVLFRLRRPGQTGYAIPRGGLYERVSCPNYLGELIEWTGWAVLTWSLAGLSFAVYTAANLVPRALAHHRWYRTTFGADYPARRKALIPFVI